MYPGGQKALNAFIYKHLQYPKEAGEAGIEGSVYLRYSIDPSGKVVDAKVISSLGYGCDEEAIRVVKLLKFKADKVFKARVLFHKKIRIWFKPKTKALPSQSNIQYNLQPAKEKVPRPQPRGKSKSYHYTITIKPTK